MAQKFRFDGWVKSATGAAIAGSQVFVCFQPANTDSYPPTPLAPAYEDVNGLVPVTFPLITDGFGHFEVYVAAGRYTIVVALSGVIQQVYEDQVPMGSSVPGTDTTPVLETNGTPNTSQDVLNLKSGTNVTLTPDGSGGVTIAATGGGGSSLELEVNDVPNVDQTILNLVDSASVSWVDNGDGSVSATASSSSLGSAAYMISAGSLIIPEFTGTAAITSAGDRVRVFKFSLLSQLTFTQCSVREISGASHFSFGVYSLLGNKIIDSGVFTGSGGSPANYTNIFSPVTLVPGIYYFAQTADNSASNPSTSCITIGGSGASAINVGTGIIWGKAANSSVAGVLPSTLGAITADTSDGTMAIVLWEQ